MVVGHIDAVRERRRWVVSGDPKCPTYPARSVYLRFHRSTSSERRARSSRPLVDNAASVGSDGEQRSVGLARVALGGLWLLTALYGWSVVAIARPESGYLTMWEGWVSNLIYVGAPLVILFRVVTTSDRTPWGHLALSLGLFSNAVGGFIFTFHDQNLDPIPFPGTSDVFYLLTYVGLVIGVIQLVHRSHSSSGTVRTDGLIMALGVIAVASIFTLQPALAVSGDVLPSAVGLAYPMLDLVVLVLLAAGFAARGHRPTASMVALAAGILAFSGGDIVYLSKVGDNSYVPGTLLDVTWLVGVMCMSSAAWIPSRAPDVVTSKRNLQFLPVAGAVSALVVPALQIVTDIPPVAIALAVVTISLVLIRLGLSLRDVNRLLAVSREARTDELTALPNRRGFFEALDDLLGASDHVAVLLFDLDGFKAVNDTYGHAAGDELLQVLASRLRNRLPDVALVARLGGDEFAAVLPTNRATAAVLVANEMIGWMSEPVTIAGVEVAVGASCGVALAPGHGTTRNELLRHADVAMYASKRAGDRRAALADRTTDEGGVPSHLEARGASEPPR